ncbi:Tim44 domain-containing protein [Peteryoungia desertarenae]|uniref:Tim44 domain-containing protein n=1 Tax=Peteryoungia desertarenae TaxID=1813451 RepID=A0ABX6QRP9_9HYPH|nr:Tim44 domain-containing protein [Peteryoungia desertarenae]QLF71158.1 Tim44 domain-containing protein [Peteryoungia desertarenae]
MQRYGKVFASLALGMMVTLVAVDYAEARRGFGGGFGSRGTRTFDAPAQTRTAPTPAAPIERTMTPRTNAAQPNAAAPAGAATQTAARSGGMFGGLAGGLMGGLLLGGLFGLLMGTGFGGGFGLLGLLLQGLLIFFLIRFAMRMFANRRPAYADGMSRDNASGDGAGGPAGNGGGAGRPLFEIPRMGGGAARSFTGRTDEIGVTPQDLDSFEKLLQEMQAAYAAEDYSALRRITTPEAMSYLAEELSDNATKGIKNQVRDVHLVQGDVAESWREDKLEYATVAMRYEAVDYMIDRQTGNVVDGDAEAPVETTEIWTFVRRDNTRWQISAIQGVEG